MLRLSTPNISEEAIAAVAGVLRSGYLVHGPEGEAFEKELATYLDCADVVLVSSGTAALHLALLALDIGPGDAVLVPDFSFPATANAVALAGARPLIVDVEPDSYTIDCAQLALTIEQWTGPERIRAVMPVHEFGQPAAMPEISAIAAEHGLFVVEDAACALGASIGGAKVGTLGAAGCFSFHPRKTLTTGEGGAIAIGDPELAARLRRLRSHGMERGAGGVEFREISTNYRLTNFQAALGRSQLPHLDDWIAARRGLARAYIAALEPLATTGHLRLPAWHEEHSWQTFMVVLDPRIDRGAAIDSLRDEGIECNLGAQSLSTLGLYGESPNAPVGAALYHRGLALPLCEQMSAADIDTVTAALARALHA